MASLTIGLRKVGIEHAEVATVWSKIKTLLDDVEGLTLTSFEFKE